MITNLTVISNPGRYALRNQGKLMVLSIRGEKESSWTYSNNTYTDVTLDLGGRTEVGGIKRSNTPSSGMDRVIGIEVSSPDKYWL